MTCSLSPENYCSETFSAVKVSLQSDSLSELHCSGQEVYIGQVCLLYHFLYFVSCCLPYFSLVILSSPFLFLLDHYGVHNGKYLEPHET